MCDVAQFQECVQEEKHRNRMLEDRRLIQEKEAAAMKKVDDAEALKVCACVRVRVLACVCACVCAYVCMCVCGTT